MPTAQTASRQFLVEETHFTVLTARTSERLFALELILYVIAAHVFFFAL